MRVAFFIVLIVSAITLANPSMSTDYTDLGTSGGAISGTVTLSEQSSVIRNPRRRHYGMGRRNRTGENSGEKTASRSLIWLEGTTAVEESDGNRNPVLNQKNKSFDPNLIAIRKHDTVRILNSDPVYHNVFSLSKTKKFDVGRRPEGDYMDVVFDRAGKVDVFCDIHSNMHAVIYVLPSRAIKWKMAKVDEPFTISDIAPGTYTLRIFAVGFEEFQESVKITANEEIDLGEITLSK